MKNSETGYKGASVSCALCTAAAGVVGEVGWAAFYGNFSNPDSLLLFPCASHIMNTVM